MKQTVAAHKQLINEAVEVVQPPPLLGFIHRPTGTTEIRQNGKTIAAIDEPASWLGRQTRLLIAGRRFRWGRAEGQGLADHLKNFLAGFFSVPQRRAVWRTGAGVATEIVETSQSRKSLSGQFELDGQRYTVQSQLEWGLLSASFERRIAGPDGPLASLEESDFDRHRFFLTPYHPIPLDALVIALHMIFWLEESSSQGGAAGGAGGGGGGGGGC